METFFKLLCMIAIILFPFVTLASIRKEAKIVLIITDIWFFILPFLILKI